MESDLTQYLPQNDPTVQLWDRINQEFQIGSTIIVYVNADDIRDPNILREIDRVTTKINTYELDKGKTDGIFSVSSPQHHLTLAFGTEFPGVLQNRQRLWIGLSARGFDHPG